MSTETSPALPNGDPAAAFPGARSFCSTLATEEPLAGTAPHRPSWALIEHPGPWGREALLDAPWPEPGLGARIAAAVDAAGVRAVLAREPGRRGRAPAVPSTDPRAPREVLLARCGPEGWLARREVPTTDLAELDWAGLAQSDDVPAGWTRVAPLWAVCTHGTRDACCARLGRPVSEAFDAAAPGAVREISHSGGHRFAGVALALPTGLMHGRVTPQDAALLVRSVAAGRVVDRLLRGEVHRPAADQVATAALRERLGDDRLGSLTRHGPAWEHHDSDGRTSRWLVEVTEHPGPTRPASCGAAPSSSSVLRATVLPATTDGL
ncbi:sucrase ferredoxin [Actinotalea sp.]|uniref:sucrase ferredoxin n=1 Tax=Actinotalea sp. TaxID=1872145 RepID=UPI00356AA309